MPCSRTAWRKSGDLRVSVGVGLVDVGQADEPVRVAANCRGKIVVQAAVQACVLEHGPIHSGPRHLLEHELGWSFHRLQAGWKELQVEVLAVSGPFEPTVAADAKVHVAQTGDAVQAASVQRLLAHLRVVAQPPDGLAVRCHVQLQELVVLCRAGEARHAAEIRKDVNV